MRRIYFDNSHGYESLAECIVLQAVKEHNSAIAKRIANSFFMVIPPCFF